MVRRTPRIYHALPRITDAIAVNRIIVSDLRE
jgi:hypothetical protein